MTRGYLKRGELEIEVEFECSIEYDVNAVNFEVLEIWVDGEKAHDFELTEKEEQQLIDQYADDGGADCD
jgi:hypothetical protein